jgi:hypothetical protein
MSDSGLQTMETDAELVSGCLEPETGRLRKSYYDSSGKILEDLQEIYQTRKVAAMKVQQEKGISSPLPEMVYSLADVTPDGRYLLCRVEDATPYTTLDLHSGKRVPYFIHDHQEQSDLYGNVTYSPDGEYVLACFDWGPDSELIENYLQLFTRDGEFIEEIAAVEYPCRAMFWLHNNWLVYADGGHIAFRKFLGGNR